MQEYERLCTQSSPIAEAFKNEPCQTIQHVQVMYKYFQFMRVTLASIPEQSRKEYKDMFAKGLGGFIDFVFSNFLEEESIKDNNLHFKRNRYPDLPDFRFR